jgi:hypothetical protein
VPLQVQISPGHPSFQHQFRPRDRSANKVAPDEAPQGVTLAVRHLKFLEEQNPMPSQVETVAELDVF